MAIPRDERPLRTLDGDDHCAIRDLTDTERRYFLRVLLPIRVHGREGPCSWGIWAEVSAEAYQKALALWRGKFLGRQSSLVCSSPRWLESSSSLFSLWLLRKSLTGKSRFVYRERLRLWRLRG